MARKHKTMVTALPAYPITGTNKRFPQTGSAVTMVLCFLAMCLASFYFGRIYFPVPYDLKTTGIYMLSTLFVVYTFRLFDFDNQTIGEVFAGIISVVFVVVVFIIERRKIHSLK